MKTFLPKPALKSHYYCSHSFPSDETEQFSHTLFKPFTPGVGSQMGPQ